MAVAKVDSKGRIILPREIHEMLGDVVELERAGKEKVLLSKTKRVRIEKGTGRAKGNEDLMKLLDKEPRRTGKPENPSPNEMKSIWAVV
jgi:bifunctional DNA-binding transcriptional regulator/antitoxin component of YhaV-PrlF toxin-antitoxin module